MKAFSSTLKTALRDGKVIAAGAVYIACSPEPVAVWGGYGPLTIGDVVFQGIGDRGLASASGGALGTAAQGVTLELSGVEPASLALFDAGLLKNAPTVVWRVIFDASGHILLGAHVFTRGRLDECPVEERAGADGSATIRAMIEGAARGLGRSRGRMRTDADQRSDSPDDPGFSAVANAAQKQLYWGGKPPASANTLPAGAGGGTRGDLAGIQPF